MKELGLVIFGIILIGQGTRSARYFWEALIATDVAFAVGFFLLSAACMALGAAFIGSAAVQAYVTDQVSTEEKDEE